MDPHGRAVGELRFNRYRSPNTSQTEVAAKVWEAAEQSPREGQAVVSTRALGDQTWKQLLHKTSLQIQQYLIVLFYIETVIIHQKQIPEEI